MGTTFLVLGSVSGFVSVALGAFAAHGLKSRLSEYLLGVFQTGVQYQFYHAFALLTVGTLLTLQDIGPLKAAGWAFVFGTFIFSGSLYILAMSGQKFWGAITPIGGVAFLIGWALLAYAVSLRGQV